MDADRASGPVTNRPLTVVALMLSVFMSAMELTVVSTAMPTVVGELGGVEHYAWVFAAYVLSSTVGVPIFGKLADLYGRKPILLGGIAVFLLGSLGCGQASSMTMLVVLRAFQGFGGGAMQSMALTIVGDIFTLEERARMQGLIGAVWGVAGLVGPLAGGFIVDRVGWPWVFYVNVPFGIASALMLTRFLHERVERRSSPLDWPGALLLGGAVTLVMLGARGSRAAWALPLAALVGVGFLIAERRAHDPILPLSLFRSRVIGVSSLAGTLMGGAMMSTVTFVPLFVQGVLGGTPTEAGSAIAPMAIGWPIASAIGGRLIPRLGFRPLVRVGLVVTASAALAMAWLLRPGVSALLPGAASAMFGVGMGLANTALLIAVQSSVGWKERGVVTASTLLFRTVGGALAVGMLGELVARAIGRHAELSGGALTGQGSGALGAALAAGLHTVFFVTAGLAALAALVGFAFPRIAVESSRKSEGSVR